MALDVWYVWLLRSESRKFKKVIDWLVGLVGLCLFFLRWQHQTPSKHISWRKKKKTLLRRMLCYWFSGKVKPSPRLLCLRTGPTKFFLWSTSSSSSICALGDGAVLLAQVTLISSNRERKLFLGSGADLELRLRCAASPWTAQEATSQEAIRC